MNIKGRSAKTGLPVPVPLVSSEIFEVLRRPARQIADEVLSVLESTSPELVSDISVNGITLTGGEPLFQPEFAVELARSLRREKIHVALETCGFASPEVFDALTAEVDLIYFDVKILDSERSRRWTGVDSAPILANLRRLCASGRPFVVRTPLIPGVNDSPAERAAVERLVRRVVRARDDFSRDPAVVREVRRQLADLIEK